MSEIQSAEEFTNNLGIVFLDNPSRREVEELIRARQSPQGEDALIDERETLEHWDEHDVGTLTNALESAIDAYDALRARLASAQSSAQGEGAREIVAARDEEWKAWIKAKGFNLEPLAGCL